jgi:Flp pilus assembly protein TadB
LSEDKKALSNNKKALSEDKTAMSDHREAMSEDKTTMSNHKTAMSDDGSQMSELDKQLAQWQSAYKDATPSVDTDALIKETKSARFKLKLKGAVDLVLGLAVSVWCLTLVLFEPLSTYQFLLFMVLTPIPAAFGAWGYWVRQKQWKVQTLDVQSMLAFKQNQLKQQLHYWKISLYGCLALWCGLLALAVFNVLMFNAFTLWGTQLLINSVVVFIVYRRYKKLAADLPSALAKIDDMK